MWTAESVLSLASDYRAACVLSAAVDLRVFELLVGKTPTAEEVASAIDGDERGTTILLDTLAALDLLVKRGDRYESAEGLDTLLGGHEPGSVLAMARHHGSCLRRWTQLAEVVRTGHPVPRIASVQGKDADEFAFIEAMDNVSAPMASVVFEDLGDLDFSCVLDIGGGSGTWTAELLRRHPSSRAILFDLPHVMPWARRRLEREGLADRVELVPGDFETDPLPQGADLAWLSAIAHQNSREQNRRLFEAIRDAIEPGGRLLVRDVVLDPSRTSPTFGALFAVNMLVATEGGNTFTLDEYRKDLESAGFEEVRLLRSDPLMNAVVVARRSAVGGR